MPATLPHLQSLLLDLLSRARAVSATAIVALDGEDWGRLLRMADQHRLKPLLHWQLAKLRLGLPVPNEVRTRLADSFKRSTVRALALQRELCLICSILNRAGIPCVALKGAFLAFQAYPHPGLRPLRDLDILVPPEQTLRAFDALIEGGLIRPPQHQWTVESQIKAHRLHLSPLLSASGQVLVELHFRLFKPPWHGEGPSKLNDDPAFWRRCIQVSWRREVICFPSPTDLLLHLIVHAVHDHRFNNGPLLLSDIAYLIETQTIDWALFWRLARQGGYQRSCWLTLRLVERYWDSRGTVQYDMGENIAATELPLDAATFLMLQDFDASDTSFVVLALDLRHRRSLGGKLLVLIRRAIPPKAEIAGMYSVPEDSLRLYLCYPRHWWRLASERLPRYLKTREDIQDEIPQRAALERWLRE